jgi:hypothetical protein
MIQMETNNATLTTTQEQPTTFLAFPSESILQSCKQNRETRLNYESLKCRYSVHMWSNANHRLNAKLNNLHLEMNFSTV